MLSCLNKTVITGNYLQMAMGDQTRETNPDCCKMPLSLQREQDTTIPVPNNGFFHDDDVALVRQVMTQNAYEIYEEIEPSIINHPDLAEIFSEQEKTGIHSGSRKSQLKYLMDILLEKRVVDINKFLGVVYKKRPRMKDSVIRWFQSVQKISGKDDILNEDFLTLNKRLFVKETDMDVCLSFLQEKDVITSPEASAIDMQTTRQARVEALLSVLAEKGSHAICTFINCFPESSIVRQDLRIPVGDDKRPPCVASRVIRGHWKKLITGFASHVTILAAHLAACREITMDEEYLITSCRVDRDRGGRLLVCVERKGDQCLQALVKAILADNNLIPLHNLANTINHWMDHPDEDNVSCSSIEEAQQDEDNVSSSSIEEAQQEMLPWQKWLILRNYNTLRQKLDPRYCVDDLIDCGVIEPSQREMTEYASSQYERVGWLVWHLIHEGTTDIYHAFMRVLKKTEPLFYRNLATQEEQLITDENVNKYIHRFDEFVSCDGELTIYSVNTLSNKTICKVSYERKDGILQDQIRIILQKYCCVSSHEEGSLVIHLKFKSLIKLTEFWLAYLNGTLSDELLDVFVTGEMRMQYSDTKLKLDMQFSIDQYVLAAYHLSIRELCLRKTPGDPVKKTDAREVPDMERRQIKPALPFAQFEEAKELRRRFNGVHQKLWELRNMFGKIDLHLWTLEAEIAYSDSAEKKKMEQCILKIEKEIPNLLNQCRELQKSASSYMKVTPKMSAPQGKSIKEYVSGQLEPIHIKTPTKMSAPQRKSIKAYVSGQPQPGYIKTPTKMSGPQGKSIKAYVSGQPEPGYMKTTTDIPEPQDMPIPTDVSEPSIESHQVQ